MRSKLFGLVLGALVGGLIITATPVAASAYISNWWNLTTTDWETDQQIAIDYYNWSTSDIDVTRGYLTVENVGQGSFGSLNAWYYYTSHVPSNSAWVNLASSLDTDEDVLLTHNFNFDTTNAFSTVNGIFTRMAVRCANGVGTIQGLEPAFDDDGSTVTTLAVNQTLAGC